MAKKYKIESVIRYKSACLKCGFRAEHEHQIDALEDADRHIEDADSYMDRHIVDRHIVETVKVLITRKG